MPESANMSTAANCQFEGVDMVDYVKLRGKRMSFPEKLMCMLVHFDGLYPDLIDRCTNAPAGFLEDGRAFFVRDGNDLATRYLPLFFGKIKFSSFTRNLYRWGFRQDLSTNLASTSLAFDTLVFVNVAFQRGEFLGDLPRRCRNAAAEKKRRENREEASSIKKGDGRSARSTQKMMGGGTGCTEGTSYPSEVVKTNEERTFVPHQTHDAFLWELDNLIGQIGQEIQDRRNQLIDGGDRSLNVSLSDMSFDSVVGMPGHVRQVTEEIIEDETLQLQLHLPQQRQEPPAPPSQLQAAIPALVAPAPSAPSVQASGGNTNPILDQLLALSNQLREREVELIRQIQANLQVHDYQQQQDQDQPDHNLWMNELF